jgi:hypothetical protein
MEPAAAAMVLQDSSRQRTNMLIIRFIVINLSRFVYTCLLFSLLKEKFLPDLPVRAFCGTLEGDGMRCKKFRAQLYERRIHL